MLGRDVISGLSGHPMSGLWVLCFESGATAFIESGYGVRTLAQCFGATEGAGDLLDKIVGQEIIASTDDFGILEGFMVADEVIDTWGMLVEPGEWIDDAEAQFRYAEAEFEQAEA